MSQQKKRLTKAWSPALSAGGSIATSRRALLWRSGLTLLEIASHLHALNTDGCCIDERVGEPKEGCSNGKERLHGFVGSMALTNVV